MTLTVKEYNEFTHTDLNAELSARINTVDGNGANAFIEQIENFIDSKYAIDYGFKGINDKSTDYQKTCYKKAIIYQIIYELQNGSLWNDSGYNLGSGLIIDPTLLHQSMVAPVTHQFMRIGGMANFRRG